MADEITPLLESSTHSSAKIDAKRCRPSFCKRMFKWRFFVEPVLVIYFFGEFPVDAINQRYILDWVGENLVRNHGGTDDGGRNQSASFDVGLKELSSLTSDLSTCSDNNSSSEARRFQDQTQKIASWFIVVEAIVSGVPAIVTSILLNAASDRYGRRLAVIPPLVGVLVSSLASYLVVLFRCSIAWLLLKDLIYGCCGSFATIMAACFAYVTDQIKDDVKERQMLRLTVLQMAMLIAGVVSPVIIGAIVDTVGYANCLLIPLCAAAANFFYVVLLMPNESVGEANQPPTRTINQDHSVDESSGECAARQSTDDDFEEVSDPNGSVINTAPVVDSDVIVGASTTAATGSGWLCDGFKRTIALFGVQTPDGRRGRLLVLLAAFFVTTMPTYNITIQNMFAMNRPLCWSISQVGYFAGFSLGVCTIGGVIAAWVLKRCMSDISIAILAAIAAVATSIFKSCVVNTTMMFASTSLNMFVVLLIPSVRSLMSNSVESHEQGAVFGGIASIEVICFTLGGIIFNAVYSSTLQFASGFVFVAMAMFYAVGCLLLLTYRLVWNSRAVVYEQIQQSIVVSG